MGCPPGAPAARRCVAEEGGLGEGVRAGRRRTGARQCPWQRDPPLSTDVTVVNSFFGKGASGVSSVGRAQVSYIKNCAILQAKLCSRALRVRWIQVGGSIPSFRIIFCADARAPFFSRARIFLIGKIPDLPQIGPLRVSSAAPGLPAPVLPHAVFVISDLPHFCPPPAGRVQFFQFCRIWGGGVQFYRIWGGRPQFCRKIGAAKLGLRLGESSLLNALIVNPCTRGTLTRGFSRRAAERSSTQCFDMAGARVRRACAF